MNPDINGNSAGGVDITITLSSEEVSALGSDIATFADWLHTALVTLAGLRSLPLSAHSTREDAKADPAIGDRVRYIGTDDRPLAGRTGIVVPGGGPVLVTVEWDSTEGLVYPRHHCPPRLLAVINEDSQGEETALDGVSDLRWHTILNSIDRQLLPRLEGIRDAAIRAATNSGYSLNDLALALDVPRSTAQYRRQVLTASEPSSWENWATSGGPQTYV